MTTTTTTTFPATDPEATTETSDGERRIRLRAFVDGRCLYSRWTWWPDGAALTEACNDCRAICDRARAAGLPSMIDWLEIPTQPDGLGYRQYRQS